MILYKVSYLSLVFQEILVLESLVFQDLFLGHKTLLVIMVVVPFSSWLRLAIVLAAVVLLSILCLQQLNVSIRFTQKDKDKYIKRQKTRFIQKDKDRKKDKK